MNSDKGIAAVVATIRNLETDWYVNSLTYSPEAINIGARKVINGGTHSAAVVDITINLQGRWGAYPHEYASHIQDILK